jgi:Protein of unknown function (DUF4240)
MDDKRFWDVIAAACKRDAKGSLTTEWGRALVEQLARLTPEEIVRFDGWFHARTDALYTRLHWGAAYLINGGASDDGFYYWRCWLVGMGKPIYEAALKDPDSLADVLAGSDRHYHEAEIYSAPIRAWRVLGLQEEEFDKARDALERTHQPLTGEGWDYGDHEQARRRLPRLAALFLANVDD